MNPSRVSRRAWLTGALLVVLGGCGGPPPAARPPSPPAPMQPSPPQATIPADRHQIAAHGVSFTLPFAETEVAISQTPAVRAGPNDPYWANSPPVTTFAFSPFFSTALADQRTRIQPQIRVYATADFEQFGSAPFGFADQLTTLQLLLRDRPALNEPPHLPYLPPIPASQAFHARSQYLDFTNGSGVAYLTVLTQDTVAPLTDGLMYTFQGLTNDGATYVSATFPVSVNHADAAASTVQDGHAVLTAADPIAAFEPDLPLLDQLLRSLQVEE